jgi:hypothetical protein
MRIMQEWFVLSIVHSAVIFAVPTAIQYASGGVWGHPEGTADGLWYYGLQLYTCLIMAMHSMCSQLTCTWTAWSHFFFWGSWVFYAFFVVTYSSLEMSEYLWHVAAESFMSVTLYVALPLIVVVMLCLRVVTDGALALWARWRKPRVFP